jgi:hypothetical protein
LHKKKINSKPVQKNLFSPTPNFFEFCFKNPMTYEVSKFFQVNSKLIFPPYGLVS